MSSMLRTRFGIPGIIATLALVFAMTGGAFAAKYIITSPKQIKPSVLKKLKGKRGPAGQAGAAGAVGPVGPAGSNGTNGKDGTNGTNGKDGTNGQSVTSEAATVEECSAGGTKYTSASGTNTVCNGEDGTDGTDATFDGGPLDPGVMLTGSWAGTTPEGTATLGAAAISFPIRLPAAIAAVNTHIVYAGHPVPADCENGGTPGPAGFANPEAAPGHFCLYQRSPTPAAAGATPNPAATAVIQSTGVSGGTSQHGASVTLTNSTSTAIPTKAVYGTWAVTAPTP